MRYLHIIFDYLWDDERRPYSAIGLSIFLLGLSSLEAAFFVFIAVLMIWGLIVLIDRGMDF